MGGGRMGGTQSPHPPKGALRVPTLWVLPTQHPQPRVAAGPWPPVLSRDEHVLKQPPGEFMAFFLELATSSRE